jgi:ribonuclease HI
VESLLIYTDGACSGNPGPGGYGSILTDYQRVIELGAFVPATTNNRMELVAVIVALHRARQDFSNIQNVQIYTDSVYVIRGITQWIHGWKRRGWMTQDNQPVTNKDLWQNLEQAVRGFKIEWLFIRGHQGIPGNERCDEIGVSFSKRTAVSLYEGTARNYLFDVSQKPVAEALPEMNGGARSGAEKKPSWYISLIAGKVRKYDNWSACEADVKGRPGVKFKKVSSIQEEQAILKSWGAL